MLKVTIASPKGILLETETEVVIAKTINGEVSFYPNHLPYLSTIDNGYIKVNNQTYEIDNGSILLDENNNVTILINREK